MSAYAKVLSLGFNRNLFPRAKINEFENLVVNRTDRIPVEKIASPLRRRILIGSAVAALFSARSAFGATPRNALPFGFQSVAISRAGDSIALPPGYKWSVVAAWGDPITGNSKSLSSDVSDSAAEQAQQFGMHHDGGAYFPENGSSRRGLWVVNHEYTDDGLLHPGGMSAWTAEKVQKSQAAHGVTVCLIERQPSGDWRPIPSPLARRITASTPCGVSGPASGHSLMKTAADPAGNTILGTLNNCAHGVTPWGTYLTCEENFNGYFISNGTITAAERRVGLDAKGFGFRWHEFDERFDAGKHPNELNRFGWVVEIDPRDPKAKPTKRTALGRFKHEGAWVTLAKDQRVVVYMGDDQRNEYVYKFVSRGPYDPKTNPKGSGLLDDGILYVARFDTDGSGRWIALEHGKNGLTSENGFPDQATVAIHARMAADHVGATPMDRPEWIAVHPKSGDVYVTLTNNSERGTRTPINAANPRENNLMGHILRWKETGQNAASLTFKWELFVLAGDPNSSSKTLQGDIKGDWFGSPDGLWFDDRGILWTQTDISTNTLGKGAYAEMPNNCMYAADPVSREFRRFLIGPKGCEITGVDLTPDHKTMFVNIQHPGESPSERSDPANPTAISSWPDAEITKRPRSATIAIWREDGRDIGA